MTFVFCCACSVFWESLTVVCQRRIAVTFPSETRHDATHRLSLSLHPSFCHFPAKSHPPLVISAFYYFPTKFFPQWQCVIIIGAFHWDGAQCQSRPSQFHPTRFSQLHSRVTWINNIFLSQLGWRKKTGPLLKSKTFIGVVCPTRVFDEEKGPWPLSRTNNLYVFYICVFDEEKGVGHC